MTRFSDDLKVIFDELKSQREELAVQMHLAGAEARDEWEEVEKQWQHFSFRTRKVLDELKESSEDVEEDLKMLGEDLKEHYTRIKRQLQ